MRAVNLFAAQLDEAAIQCEAELLSLLKERKKLKAKNVVEIDRSKLKSIEELRKEKEAREDREERRARGLVQLHRLEKERGYERR